MNTLHTTPRFRHRLHLLILRKLVIFANVMGLSTYAFLRIIFYDLPFVLQEELLIALRIVAWSTGIAVGASFIIFVGHALAHFIRHRKQFEIPRIVHVGDPSANNNSAA